MTAEVRNSPTQDRERAESTPPGGAETVATCVVGLVAAGTLVAAILKAIGMGIL